MKLSGRNINEVLPEMMRYLLTAPPAGSRNGLTLERTFQHVVLEKPQHREILLKSRKHNLAAQIAETMWVLAGRNDVEWLARYLPRAADFSDDGETWRAGYGARLRNFGGYSDGKWSEQGIDQFRRVYDILSEDINSRRAVISIWDPTIDFESGRDIPCNDWLSFLHRGGALHLQVGVRSNDAMWGWSGINAFEWSALLEVMAGMLNVQVGELHFSITSLHLYENHYGRARSIVNESPRTSDYSSVPFNINRAPGSHSTPFDSFDLLVKDWFVAEEAIRNGADDIDRIVDAFPEPMLRSWLAVIAWWWTGDSTYLDILGENSRLAQSARVGVQPKRERYEEFIEAVDTLHKEKHAAYGDSWKKRGEFVAIQANIARKVDRLGTGISTQNETQTDTAIDLLVYLCKYRWWLVDEGEALNPCNPHELLDQVDQGGGFSNYTEPILSLMQILPAQAKEMRTIRCSPDELTVAIQENFERLLQASRPSKNKVGLVDIMIRAAFVLAYRRWSAA